MAKNRKLLIFILVGLIILGSHGVCPGQPALGDTVSFYAFDFHFFQVHYKTLMTLRAIGPHAYIWVEDSSWARGDVDSADVAAIDEAFNVRTPAADPTASGILADTSGIYDKVTRVLGPPPDMDGDPRIYLLILDVIDGAQMVGYFDPLNQRDPREEPNSNGHELIYIDCNPTDLSSDRGLGSVVQQFAHLVHYNNDPDEECWIEEGLTHFAKFLCGYGLTNFGYTKEVLDFLTDCIGEIEPSAKTKTAMFIQYLFEQYGIDVIETLATDRDTSGLGAVDAALAAHGYEVDAAELFRAEILAWFMDSPEEEFFGGKYSFKYFEADAMIGAKTPTYWGTVDDSPYRYVANQWSADFIGVLLPAPNLGNTIVFNGDLNHDFQVMAIKTNGSYFSKFKAADVDTAQFLELDSYNRVVVDASGLKATPREYGLIYLAVIHYGARDGSTARPMYVVDDDVTPPEPLHLGVLQNPLADKYLDIYIFSNEKLYFSSWVDSLPFVQIGLAEQTDTLALESFASVAGDAETNWPKTYIYHGEWVLTADGNYLIVAEGWDIAGNKAPNDTTSVIAKLIVAGTGGMVASEDGSVALSIPPGALARDTYLTLWAVEPGQGSLSQTKPNLAHSPYGWLSPQPKAGISVGWAYRFGPPGRKLNKPALLSIHYGDEDVVGLDESELSIYRLEDSEWVWVGGEVDEANNVITAQVSQLGQYQIHLGRPGAADDDGLTPKTYLLHQNYPNPFNPETEILYGLPQSAHVSVTVYNVLGQVVKVLVNEDQPAGSYRAQWDGRSNTGEEVASGIYFYQMQAGDFKATKRMVLMR